MTIGRPTLYTPELAQRVCDLVATHTIGLSHICKKYPELPCRDTIYEWRWKHKDFSDKYADAKRQQAELMAEEIADIADDGTSDYYEDKDGNLKLDSEHVQRSRLRVDTRKWIACKLLPKVYGESQRRELDVAPDSLMSKIIDKL